MTGLKATELQTAIAASSMAYCVHAAAAHISTLLQRQASQQRAWLAQSRCMQGASSARVNAYDWLEGY